MRKKNETMNKPPVSVEQFVMAYEAEQDRIRAMLPDGYTSLRPVLRINSEIRNDRVLYLEFNTPVEADGRRGWLNIANWKSINDNIRYTREGRKVTITAPFLELSYTGTGIEGGCPAEKDNEGCYYIGGDPEFRPAIYVKLSPIQCGTVTGNTTGLVRRDLQEAEYHYARTGQGQVSFVHIAATAGEACTLADATMDYLDAFSPVITDDYCFDWFKLASREPLHAMGKDSNEKYGSVVAYDFRFTDAWSLKLESPKLRQLIVRATDAVHKRLEVGEYWDFKPPDDGLGIPPELSRRVT